MKITEVTVKSLRTYGEYQNTTFGYTASVAAGEDPEAVKNELLKRIQSDFNDLIIDELKAEEQRRVDEQVSWEESRKRREIDELQMRIDKMIEFLKAHGVDITTDELPF